MLRVHDGVALDDDASIAVRPVPLDLGVDEARDARAHAHRRHQQLPVAVLARHAGEHVEEVGDVRRERQVRGQQAQVRVDAGGLGVVVAGADVDVAAQPAGLASHHESALGVGLEADQAVGHVGACALEGAGPDDVGALVEAGLDLHHDDDLLAALGGVDEGVHDG